MKTKPIEAAPFVPRCMCCGGPVSKGRKSGVCGQCRQCGVTVTAVEAFESSAWAASILTTAADTEGQ